MSTIKTLYFLLKQFDSLIIKINTEEIKLIVGTRSLSFNNDRISGENLTITNVKKFIVQEDTEDVDKKSVLITFDHSVNMKICCI